MRHILLPLVLGAALVACGDEGPPAPADIVIAPNLPRVPMGDSRQLTATVVDASGRAIEGYPVTFSSSDEAVITVNHGGLLTSVGGLGTSIISVAAGDVTAEVEATVVLGPSTLLVSPDVLELVVGDRVPLTISVTDENGALVSEPELLFQTTAPVTAQVSADGFVTAMAQGFANVIVTSGGLQEAIEVWVDAP
jgi:uncharacterized protein YjdB